MTPDRAIWEDYARHGVALHLHRARLRHHLPADRTFHVREALRYRALRRRLREAGR